MHVAIDSFTASQHTLSGLTVPVSTVCACDSGRVFLRYLVAMCFCVCPDLNGYRALKMKHVGSGEIHKGPETQMRAPLRAWTVAPTLQLETGSMH